MSRDLVATVATACGDLVSVLVGAAGLQRTSPPCAFVEETLDTDADDYVLALTRKSRVPRIRYAT